MDWARAQRLNLVGFHRIRNSYEKVGIPISARPHVPSSICEEMLGNGDHGFVEALWSSAIWETCLRNQGCGHIWKEIQVKYGNDVTSLYNDLRQLILLEKEEIEMEDKILQILGNITIKINNMNGQQGTSEPTVFGSMPAEMIFFDMQLQIDDVLDDLETLTNMVTNIIANWEYSKRYEQTWEWVNCPQIQIWLDYIFNQCLSLWDWLKPLEFLVPQLRKSEQLLSRLLNSTFTQELQPCRFVKLQCPLSLKYRHLMGKHLSLEPGQFAVVSLLNSEQVNSLLMSSGGHFRTELNCLSSTTVDKNKADVFRSDNQNGQLTVSFRKVKIRQSIRTKRNDDSRVMDQKFCFLCEMVVTLRPNLEIRVWALSQPLICGTNTCQRTRSLGTIEWDNAICESNRTTLNVQKEIPWPTLLNALDNIHMSIANIPLSENNKQHLKTRLFGNSHANEDTEVVTFKAFCVDNLPGTDFTFWGWFYQGLEFGKKYFSDMLREGYVAGFLGRENAHHLIGQSQQGTIMIRFSDSIRRALAITWKHRDGVVYSAGPITADMLEFKTLPETVLEIQSKLNLTQLYPRREIQGLLTYLNHKCDPPKGLGTRGYVPFKILLVPDILQL